MELTNEEKAELLAEANRRYPIGTVHTGYRGERRYVILHELYFNFDDNILPKRGSGCIYHSKSKTWATIISTPSKTYELWD